jgi:choline/glycine/proline betaine transport protein
MTDNVSKMPDNMVAKSGLLAGMNPLMAAASMIMILGFVGFTIMDAEYASSIFTQMKDFIIGTLGWFYVLVVSSILLFVIWLMCSRFGSARLGKSGDTPDFSTFSWICMLFSAGLGSGLIYWGVAEPIFHIQDNPFLAMEKVEPNSVEAAVIALRVTIFHWGLHGWALYVLVGLGAKAGSADTATGDVTGAACDMGGGASDAATCARCLNALSAASKSARRNT